MNVTWKVFEDLVSLNERILEAVAAAAQPGCADRVPPMIEEIGAELRSLKGMAIARRAVEQASFDADMERRKRLHDRVHAVIDGQNHSPEQTEQAHSRVATALLAAGELI